MSAAPSLSPPAVHEPTPERWRYPRSAVVHAVFGHSTWCGKYRMRGEPVDASAPITCRQCLACAGSR